ncbi:MAG: hypothetical protein AAF567_14990 [Actinomycetota bacterium]
MRSDRGTVEYDAELGQLALGWTIMVLVWNGFRCWYAWAELDVAAWALAVFALMAFGTAVPYARASGRLARAIAGRSQRDSGGVTRDTVIIVVSVLGPYIFLMFTAEQLGTSQLIGVGAQIFVVLGFLGLTLFGGSSDTLDEPREASAEQSRL